MRWVLSDPDASAVARLREELDLRLPAAQVLAGRGYGDPDAARRFLAPSLSELHDPRRMLGLDAALRRLRQAVAGREKILIYGDYDVDGTTSIVVLRKAIELAGGAAEFHVPHRLRDGYGMRTEVVEEAAARGVQLIISVDTGIRAGAVVEHARARGIDVIVTDHHLPEEALPPAVAVLNPNQPACGYPEKNLCGAGVVFKLVQALVATLDWDEPKRQRMLASFLKLVAIATVADVVPLTGENRVIVKHGLEGLRNWNNPGLRALAETAGLTEGQAPSAHAVAFQIAPRINAAGRMASAADVIELFTTAGVDRARAIAGQLDALNRERQDTEAEIVRFIVSECEKTPVEDAQRALVFAGEGWHRGVVGIVASRVVERFHRPAFVLGIENGVAQGSGRSIAAFHLLDSLEAMPELFAKFGGHAQAAGVTLPAAAVDEFRRRFAAYAGERLTVADLEPVLRLDARLALSDLRDDIVAEVLALAPFGMGNPAPVFAVEDAVLGAAPEVVKEKHLRCVLRQNGRSVKAMAWRAPESWRDLPAGIPVRAALVLQDDPGSAQRGYAPWTAVLRDLGPRESK